MKDLGKTVEYNLGTYQRSVENALVELTNNEIISRIWGHDHTVWKPEPGEIVNRLGWLHSPEVMTENVGRITDFAEEVCESGYTHALLLGMGGSSLAPEVFRKTFGVKEGHLDLSVCDTTDPATILHHAEAMNPQQTLVIVSTKSGTTVETLSLFKFFYNRMTEAVGKDLAGEHFIAITDPGTPLTDIAQRFGFRRTFLNDPNIGGRYSALSYFGLVPAALMGIDIGSLLDRAMTMVCNGEACNCPVAGNNIGGRLGVALGEIAKAGRDKVTLVASSVIESFGDWAEQLIAESTGKEDTGILPVVGEPLGLPANYGADRLFVYIGLDGDESQDGALVELEREGNPLVRLSLRDPYDLGGQFFLWEMAVALAGSRMGINPFDQPNVEAAKVRARELRAEYQQKGRLPAESALIKDDDITVYGEVSANRVDSALTRFLEQAEVGSYIAIQAYLQPTAETDSLLQTLRINLRNRFRLATTLGYGPRFLHSTGQLHKGDAGHGLFIQCTADDERDTPIPDEAGSSASSMTFGVLKAAQAIGDRQALMSRGRKVIRFHVGTDVVGGLKRLIKNLH